MFSQNWTFETTNSAETIQKRLQSVTLPHNAYLGKARVGMGAYFSGRVGKNMFDVMALPDIFGWSRTVYTTCLYGKISEKDVNKKVITVEAEPTLFLPMKRIKSLFETIVCDYYYETHYSLDLCLEYMTHKNVGDLYRYRWEKDGDGYIFTFVGMRGSIWDDFGKDAVGSTWRIRFNEIQNGTSMRVSFAEQSSCYEWSPVIITAEDLHLFWQRKLDMELVKIV